MTREVVLTEHAENMAKGYGLETDEVLQTAGRPLGMDALETPWRSDRSYRLHADALYRVRAHVITLVEQSDADKVQVLSAHLVPGEVVPVHPEPALREFLDRYSQPVRVGLGDRSKYVLMEEVAYEEGTEAFKVSSDTAVSECCIERQEEPGGPDALRSILCVLLASAVDAATVRKHSGID